MERRTPCPSRCSHRPPWSPPLGGVASRASAEEGKAAERTREDGGVRFGWEARRGRGPRCFTCVCRMALISPRAADTNLRVGGGSPLAGSVGSYARYSSSVFSSPIQARE